MSTPLHPRPHGEVILPQCSLEAHNRGSLSTYRQIVYGQTQAQIDRFNSLYGEYYTAGHNQFSHLTVEEWKQQYLGGSMSEEGSPQRKFVGRATD